MSRSDAGLRRKLIDRLVVTASGTIPISPRIATYSATSTTVIMTGPETVPPGRNSAMPTWWRMVADALPTASTTHLFCGNSLARNSAISFLPTIGAFL